MVSPFQDTVRRRRQYFQATTWFAPEEIKAPLASNAACLDYSAGKRWPLGRLSIRRRSNFEAGQIRGGRIIPQRPAASGLTISGSPGHRCLLFSKSRLHCSAAAALPLEIQSFFKAPEQSVQRLRTTVRARRV